MGLKDKLLSALGQGMDATRDIAGKAADATKGIAGVAAEKAKAGGRIAKLTMDIAREKEDMKKTYLEIGKLYYEQAKDAPEGYFAPLFAQADVLAQGILEKENEVQSLKDAIEAARAEKKAAGAAGAELDVDIADFEEIVDATENDGTASPGDKGEE